ncbi:YciI-like protein [Zunongwangia sp. F363]|uniref:YciI-like protein n=1 Tax=Autumnicola tepida TaxID=3075595 RepID=A0ABU3CBY6_9FLAO|nr:YciI-like protein [Zunongwangia sp. F363]MDT0643852.1 YciI-like protein [Zunongwangia sp. F363]
MNYYILKYRLQENYLEERGKYRTEHLNLAQEAAQTGTVVMAGALENPADEAIFIFRAESEEAAKTFAEGDPYVKNGLVKEWSVRKWNVVIKMDN